MKISEAVAALNTVLKCKGDVEFGNIAGIDLLKTDEISEKRNF